MTEIEKFLNEQFTQVITEDKMGIKCLYKHKEGVIDDGVVFFEFAKKKWSRKPIMNKRQFVIVDADMGDVLQFLHQYYNLSEEDYSNIRHYIINTSIKKVEQFFGEEDYFLGSKSSSVMRCLRINLDILDVGKYVRVISEPPMSRTPKSEMYPMIRLISRIVFIIQI